MGRAPASSSTLLSWVRLLQHFSSVSWLAGGRLNTGASHLSAGINVKSSLGFLLGGTGCVGVCVYIYVYFHIYMIYIRFCNGLQWEVSLFSVALGLTVICGSALLGWNDAQSLSLLPHKHRGPWHLSRHHIFGLYLICASHIFSPSSVWSQSEACSVSAPFLCLHMQHPQHTNVIT